MGVDVFFFLVSFNLKLESFLNPWSFVFYILEALVCKKINRIKGVFIYLFKLECV
jgi:hypothetical protein